MIKLYRTICSALYKRKINKVGGGTFIVRKLHVIGGEHIVIGKNCFIGNDCRIEAWGEYEGVKYSPEIILEDNVNIRGKCHIGAIDKVIIHKNTLLGSNVMIIDHDHGDSSLEDAAIHPSKRKLHSKGPIEIGERCWLGENVVVLSGVKIGEGTTVGANSVVTKDLPPYCVAGGIPARIIKNKMDGNDE